MVFFNREQLHLIYTNAFRMYAHLDYFGHIGLCDLISLSIGNLVYVNPNIAILQNFDANIYNTYYCPRENMNYYTEIWKHNPDCANDDYWFPIEDTETRNNILKQAIEETKPTDNE